jgi:hypothetical protein
LSLLFQYTHQALNSDYKWTNTGFCHDMQYF